MNSPPESGAVEGGALYDDPAGDVHVDEDDPSTDWKTEIGKPTASLYALLVIISNVALALSTQTRRDSHIPVSYSKWFDAVLYGLGIIYLFYAMLFLFPEDKAATPPGGKKKSWLTEKFTHPCVRLWRICAGSSDHSPHKVFTLDSTGSLSTISAANVPTGLPNVSSGAGVAGASTAARWYTADVKVRTRGSVYLKLNAIICGVGAMIYSCLEFGVWLSNRHCYETISGIIPLLLTIYISAQTYFIFLYSKRIIARHTILSRFGLMHLVATDVTIWLRVLIDQTLYEFSIYRANEHINNTQTTPVVGNVHNTSAGSHSDSISLRSGSHIVGTDGRATSVGDLDLASVASPLCARQGSLLGDVLVDASVFLYPCIIGYAVIAAGIVYVMCKNMGTQGGPETAGSGEGVDDSRLLSRQHSAISYQSCNQCQTAGQTGKAGTSSGVPEHLHRLYWLDCDQAVGGLLAGSVVLAMTIVCLILFFIFKTRNPEHAILEAQIGEAILYSLGIGAVVVAFAKTVRNLPKNRHSSVNWELDTAMLLTSMMGVYAFPILSIIGTNDEEPGTPINSILIILTSSMSILQSTIQTVYIFEASNRSIPETAQDVSAGKKIPKPGRNALTFLIVVNLAFWSMNIFKTLRSEASPMQREFFGFYEWTIITHVTVPLQILYRFHSAASLFEIWKHAYKVNPASCQCRELNEEAHRRSLSGLSPQTVLTTDNIGVQYQGGPTGGQRATGHSKTIPPRSLHTVMSTSSQFTPTSSEEPRYRGPQFS
ncbi:hypothetical protein BV898_13239 [Hypsibius exemplaris]|uniref:Otopetrin-2 n=1 Tax=Hypsibius exemplaris TaxID=2072580 RepID=A0A1W0WBH7_HYPEX|nr:hypothetical protein BV898_13239 [Hypsibius exemplaris]